MRLVRFTRRTAFVAALVAAPWMAHDAAAQQSGTIRGTVNDSVTSRGVPAVQVTIAGSTRGTVTNEQGVPLPGATVLIQGTTTGAHTDDAGRYVIVVPADRANGQSGILIARVIGYSARQVPIVLAPGSTISQNFALIVNPLNLDAVLVTGAGTSTTRERLTTTINTVDSSALD